MNDAQTIFTIFFGIYFAVTVTLTGIFKPFDTPEMCYRNGFAWWRFLASFFLLNIIPTGYFFIIYKWLSNFNMTSLHFLPLLALLFLSLGGFGFYRIYWGFMLIKRRETYIFYGKNLPVGLEEELRKREKSHREWWPHLLPGIIWIIASLLLGFFVTR